MGLGSMEATTPKSSAQRWRRNLPIHKSSPIVIPSHGPTWNSHCQTNVHKILLTSPNAYNVLILWYNHNELLLPGQAWPQRLYQRCLHQYKDRLYNELLQYHAHILYLRQHRNSKVLGVLGIHFWANRMDADLDRVRYILVQYRTMVFRLCIYLIISKNIDNYHGNGI